MAASLMCCSPTPPKPDAGAVLNFWVSRKDKSMAGLR
jgi:hypothetical protein